MRTRSRASVKHGDAGWWSSQVWQVGGPFVGSVLLSGRLKCLFSSQRPRWGGVRAPLDSNSPDFSNRKMQVDLRKCCWCSRGPGAKGDAPLSSGLP